MSSHLDQVHELITAYRAADYVLRQQDGRRTLLHIDAALPAELAAQMPHGEIGGVITACNPLSRPAALADNRRRQRELLQALRPRRVLVGFGRGDGWREPSFGVLGIDIVTLDRLAYRFRQNAILTFRARERVRLRLYRDDWRDVLAGVDADFAATSEPGDAASVVMR